MINFKEIPQGNLTNGNQDDFELFARDFFEIYGYQVLGFPARGSDAGKDLIIKEVRKGVSEIQTEVKWLVSCKHFAHSGKSVNPKIESNISDRIRTHECQGFIGFYSTLASEGLTMNLKNVQAQIFDRKKIESIIITNPKFKNVFKRYFPNSFKKWEFLNLPYDPTKLFEYYLEKEFNNEVDFLIELFFNINNLFTALVSTNNFDEFVKYSGKRIFIQNDITDQIDEIYQQQENKNLILSKFSYYVETFLVKFIKNKKMSSEKLMSIQIYNKDSILILTNKSIITNDKEINQLDKIYQKLKKIL